MDPKLKKLVITILVLFIATTIFTFYRNSKLKEKYNNKIEEIKTALIEFGDTYQTYLPTENNETITLNLRTLKYFNLIDQNLKNPLTRKRFSNNLLLTITKKKQGYEYKVWDQEKVKEDYEDINENAPFIILKGNIKEYIEVGEPFLEDGYISKNKKGLEADELKLEIKTEGKIVSKVDTMKLTTYEITYIASYAQEQTYITRQVEIRDTQAPTITTDKLTLKKDEVKNFNLMTGVTVTDNSKQKVEVTYSGELSEIPGKYIIVYKAIDSQGNTKEKKRVIRVEE